MHRHLLSSHSDPRVRQAAAEAHRARNELMAAVVRAVWQAIRRIRLAPAHRHLHRAR